MVLKKYRKIGFLFVNRNRLNLPMPSSMELRFSTSLRNVQKVASFDIFYNSAIHRRKCST